MAWVREVAAGETVVLVTDEGPSGSPEPVAAGGRPTVVVALDVVDGRERWRRVVDAIDRGEPPGLVVDASPGPAVQRWLDRVVVNVEGDVQRQTLVVGVVGGRRGRLTWPTPWATGGGGDKDTRRDHTWKSPVGSPPTAASPTSLDPKDSP